MARETGTIGLPIVNEMLLEAPSPALINRLWVTCCDRLQKRSST